jgi:hypothetical protein
VALTGEKVAHEAQVAPHRKVGQQPGHINAAVRDLGIDWPRHDYGPGGNPKGSSARLVPGLRPLGLCGSKPRRPGHMSTRSLAMHTARDNRPKTWRQVMDAMDEIEQRLEAMLLAKLPKHLRAKLTRLRDDVALPVLRNDGRRGAVAPRSSIAVPKPKHLRHLDDGEFEYYRLLSSKGFRMGEAMTMVQQPAGQEARV